MFDGAEKVRVRMAPSPTGALHVGSAHTALFNYLFARSKGGVFVLRIEDTDRARSSKEWEEDILNSLLWLGINWDEGPYRQSERSGIYREYIRKMLERGSAFYCWHTKDELMAEDERQKANKEAPRHRCEYRDLDISSDTEKIKRAVIRFKNNGAGTIGISDAVKGEVVFDVELLGDFSIAKSLDEALYNFAVVIDDYEMNITHVIRGEDHISNTPKQLLVQRALGIEPPMYAHIPLILGSDKSKLSKRHGATAVLEYRDMGYLPEALFNFLAILGWRADDDEKEIMSADEIISKFHIKNLQTSPAIFDIEKLNWMNAEYIRMMSLTEFTESTLPYLVNAGFINENIDRAYLQKVVALEKNRIKKLSEIVEASKFIFTDIDYKPELLVWRKATSADVKPMLEKVHELLYPMDARTWTKENLESILMPAAKQVGDRGKLLWPLRAALTGREASPGPFEIMEVLGKEKVLTRLRTGIEKADELT